MGPRMRRAVVAFLAVVIASCLWLPCIHLFFVPDASVYFDHKTVAPHARALANRHLKLWTDDALRQLSDALYGQQRQIQALERELERLTQRLEAAEHPAGDQPGHEIPPHY